jgi:hypothetical protein
MKDQGANWEKPAWIKAEAEYEATGGWETHHGGHAPEHGESQGEASH